MIRRLILFALMLAATVAMAGNVKLDHTATTNQTANVKMLFREAGGSYPDTSTVSWGTGATDHSGDYDTGIPAAVANVDSGGILYTLDDGTGEDGYRIDFNPNDEGWATLKFLPANSISFLHEMDNGDPEPRRGVTDARIRSFQVIGVGDTIWSGPVPLQAPVYNQAVGIYSKFHASNGTSTVESSEGYAVLISYPVPDETPPAAPTSLVATAGDGSVGLEWDDNGEPDLDDYTVYRGTVSGTRPLLQAGVLVSNYTDNTVVNGTEYFYSVTATDGSANESGHSSEVSATPAAGGDPRPAGNINSWADLIAITSAPSGTYTLGVDLDSSSPDYAGIGDAWPSICHDWSSRFTGSFDGQGYTVSDIVQTSAASSYAGFFGYLDATGTISNVGVIDISVTISSKITGGIAGVSYGTITNCYSFGGSIACFSDNGGIVGRATNGAIENCYSTVQQLGNGSDVGGIVGELNGADLTNCFADCAVTTATNHGGLVGNHTSGAITNCGWNNTAGNPGFAIGSTSGNVAYNIADDATWFYDVSQDVYDTQAPVWDFSTPIWYANATKLPTFWGEKQ